MKVGILGGTFDPVHLGHLAVAETVKRRLSLGEIIFMPAGRPQLKTGQVITGVTHRLSMLKLALDGNPDYQVSTMEIDRPGPTYTVDTMQELRSVYGDKSDLYFIVGWDTLPHLGEWRDPSRLITLCYLVAVPRPGLPPPDLTALEKEVPGISPRLIVIDQPQVDISATKIRERAACGQSLSGLVPEPVAGYIKKYNLYKQ